MRTFLLICSIIIILILITFLLKLDNKNGENIQTQGKSSTITTTSTSGVSTTHPTVLLGTKGGSFIHVRNFIEDSDVSTWYDDSTYLIGSADSISGPLYQIFYYTTDHSVVISLQGKPLSTARSVAEVELVRRFGLSQQELCSLLIRVSTPSFVSEDLSGRELGLSFCPSSISL